MSREKKSKIVGTGSFLPPFIVDNEYYCRFYPGKGAEWIEEKIGIKQRRYGFDFEANKMREGYYDDDLAEKAAVEALKEADITVNQIDVIIRVTCTAEHLYFPDAGCTLHARLGATKDCAAYTLPSGCGGLVYAIKMSDAYIRGGCARNVLIAVSNTPSSFANVADSRITERDWLNGAIFGDGASALVMSRGDSDTFLSSYWGAVQKDDPFIYPAGGSRCPTRMGNIYDHWYKMDTEAVFKYAGVHINNAMVKVLEKSSTPIEKIDWFLFHQVNLRIIERISEKTKIPMEKILIHIDKYGNTSAASIGILLDEGIRAGKIQKGNLVVIAAVGAGWQYGAFLIRWE